MSVQLEIEYVLFSYSTPFAHHMHTHTTKSEYRHSARRLQPSLQALSETTFDWFGENLGLELHARLLDPP